MKNIYEECPTFETTHFLFRKVQIEDAEDLLSCYSDVKAAELFNSDNCTSDFVYTTLEKMKNCISFWLEEYINKQYIRFAIVDKVIRKTVGTIEIFNKGNFDYLKNVGILRLDLCSEYEKDSYLSEILQMISKHFYLALGLENIMTKAIPKATTRIAALTNEQYYPVHRHTVMPYEDYYIRYVATPDEIAQSVGYCGLICTFCHEADHCGGCKSKTNCCGRYISESGCYQYNCCTEKGIKGCWECEIAPCDKDMFSEHHDIRNRTFVKCAKEEGLQQLAQYVLVNQLNGILYGWNKDYDNLESENAVLDLLHHGIGTKA